MKIEKIKHDHKLTKLIQVSLFACLLFAPLIQVAVKSAYVIANKNAKDSYYGETINEIVYEEIQYSNLEINKEYNISNNILSTMTQTNQSTFYISNLDIVAPLVSFDYTNVNQMRFYVNSEGIPRVFLYNNNTSIGRPFDLNSENINFNFTYMGSNSLNINATLLNALTFSYKTYNKYSYLDNVFTYAINQIKETDLYNWTQNTALYEGVNAMTTQLGITNQVMPILLTYWFFITIIYVIIDIIIAMFTWLTHLLIKEK